MRDHLHGAIFTEVFKMETVIAACISGVVTLVVCLITNRAAHEKTQALIAYRLQELERKVDKHNDVITRTFELERRAAVTEERIKVVNNRLADIEKGDDGK